MGLCAGRTGQILNLTSLANDVGVSSTTIGEWVSILESSYVAYTLKPYSGNINKRLIKSPKFYFYDTGLACAFLKINNLNQLKKHPLVGSIFETFVVGELMKQNLHNRHRLNLYYFRDKTGNEIDILYQTDNVANLIEIKSTSSFFHSFLKPFEYFQNISMQPVNSQIIYTGDIKQKRKNFLLVPWRMIKL